MNRLPDWVRRGSTGTKRTRLLWLPWLVLGLLTALPLCFLPARAQTGIPTATGPNERRVRQSSSEPILRLVQREDLEDPFAREDPFSPPEPPSLSDPIKPVNRVVFTFNDRFYFWLLKPGNRAYESVTTPAVRRSVRNFFRNLQEPRNFVNALLQGKWNDAHDAFGRFLFNSTFGIGGLFDVVGEDLPPVRRTFDQSLAKAHVPPGSYVLWPVAGPSSARGTVGMVADWVMDPLSWPFGVENTAVALGATSLRVVNEVSFTGSAYEDLKRYSVDPYNGLKDFYENRIAKRARE